MLFFRVLLVLAIARASIAQQALRVPSGRVLHMRSGATMEDVVPAVEAWKAAGYEPPVLDVGMSSPQTEAMAKVVSPLVEQLDPNLSEKQTEEQLALIESAKVRVSDELDSKPIKAAPADGSGRDGQRIRLYMEELQAKTDAEFQKTFAMLASNMDQMTARMQDMTESILSKQRERIEQVLERVYRETTAESRAKSDALAQFIDAYNAILSGNLTLETLLEFEAAKDRVVKELNGVISNIDKEHAKTDAARQEVLKTLESEQSRMTAQAQDIDALIVAERFAEIEDVKVMKPPKTLS